MNELDMWCVKYNGEVGIIIIVYFRGKIKIGEVL